MKKELESQTLKGKSPNIPSETIYSSQFSFECNLKNIQSNFLDSMKAKFLITNNSSHRLEDRVLYKIYIETHDKMCYLLKIGLKSFKKELKLSTSHRFSRTIPPSSSVRYRIMLYSHRKVIANFYTQSFTISDSSAEKQIKFLGVELFSNVIIPNNPLVFWIKYNVKPIPDNRTLEVHASLYDKNLILKEKPFEFKIDSSYGTELEEFRYPFSLNIPDFTAENEKLTLNISIQDIKSQNILYTKEVQLKGYFSLKGMYFQHVGYKRDIKVGETAYMVADLINKTPYRVKGNAYFFFLTESCEKKFAFRRKFKIRPGNYDKISEDITLTPELGGKKFWVLCQVKMKSKIGPILLEGKSDQYYPKIQNNPEFTVNLRASIHKDGVYFNDKIPIGIDTRIKSRYDLRNVTCEIIQNFENIEKKVIFSFKIKNLEAHHSSFHWKVPSSYGTCILEARIKVQGIDVESANISQTMLKFDLYPEPKS